MIKTKYVIAFILLFQLCINPSVAQELPNLSPKAKIEQRIGLTDFVIEYSRPSMREREIFGQLVPYEEVWRLGANEATSISFNDNIIIQGQEIPAGKYALVGRISPGSFTLIFSTQTDLWTKNSYKEEFAIAQFDLPIEPNFIPQQTLYIGFDNLQKNSGDLVISWENIQAKINIEVEYMQKALKNIETAIKALKKDEWRPYQNAASFYLNEKHDLNQANAYIDKALRIGNYWYSYWIKAQICFELGWIEEAVSNGNTAIKKGHEYYDKERQGAEFTYAAELQTTIKKWQEGVYTTPKTEKPKK
jgi:tetratricopeptide (TPR) repeat protein